MARGDSKKSIPDYSFEKALMDQHGGPIAGIDEAGRGPWAGPVVAAAVVLDPLNVPDGLNDSKKLSAKSRERLFDLITQTANVGIGIGDVERIDRENILQATLWAMASAFQALDAPAAAALVDGNKSPALPCPSTCLVKGDSRSLSIAAASIIAKVTRDRMMAQIDLAYPHYGWAQNKGYGTAHHSAALQEYGVTPHHRRSFKPVQRALLNA